VFESCRGGGGRTRDRGGWGRWPDTVAGNGVVAWSYDKVRGGGDKRGERKRREIKSRDRLETDCVHAMS
jgi:hypothetical protein